MAEVQFKVGQIGSAQQGATGSQTPALERTGGVTVLDVGGRWAELVFRGIAYHATAKAVTLAATHVSPLTANTGTPIVGLWNPTGSGVVIEIEHAIVQTTSGTPAGGFYWDTIVAATITQASFTKGLNSKTFGAGGQACVFSNLAITGGQVGVLTRIFGGLAAVAAGAGIYSAVDAVEGAIQVMPGNFAAITCKAAGTTHIVDAHIFWVEKPST